MRLSDQQALFTRDMALLTLWAYRNGYRIRDGDAYRAPGAYGAFGIKKGNSHPRSLHKQRLARDLILDLWIDGRWVYQRSTAAYEPLGLRWEAMRKGNAWGGRFGDGNHFSSSRGGRK